MVAFGRQTAACHHLCTTVQYSTEVKADLTHDCQKTLPSALIREEGLSLNTDEGI